MAGCLLPFVSMAIGCLDYDGSGLQPVNEQAQTDRASAAGGSPAGFEAPDAGTSAVDGGAAPQPGAPGAESPALPAMPVMIADAPTCGSGPHLPVTVAADDFMAEVDERKLERVAVTFRHCESQTFLTGPGGRVTVWLTRGAETWIRFEHPGYVPWLMGEIVVAESLPIFTATMVPEPLVQAVVPGFAPDRSVVLLQVQPGPSQAPAPCRIPEAVQVTVRDQPAAKVLYRLAGAAGSYDAAQATTSSEGVAVIRDLLPGATTADIVATKTGCQYQPSYGDANSLKRVPIVRVPLFPGAITYQVQNPVY